jgi:hypothetical protein
VLESRADAASGLASRQGKGSAVEFSRRPHHPPVEPGAGWVEEPAERYSHPGHSAVLAPLGGGRVDSIGEGLAPLSNAQLIERGQPSPLPSTSEVDVEAARTWLAESQASSSGEVFPTILLHMGH